MKKRILLVTGLMLWSGVQGARGQGEVGAVAGSAWHQEAWNAVKKPINAVVEHFRKLQESNDQAKGYGVKSVVKTALNVVKAPVHAIRERGGVKSVENNQSVAVEEGVPLLVNGDSKNITKSNVNGEVAGGNTPLTYAIEHNSTQSDIEQLLKINGIDINKKDTSNLNPLMRAARKGDTEIVKLLLDKGADINAVGKAVDVDGQTPLLMAFDLGKNDMVTLLLDKGADVNVIDENGKTLLDYVNKKLEKIVKFSEKRDVYLENLQKQLQAKGAKTNLPKKTSRVVAESKPAANRTVAPSLEELNMSIVGSNDAQAINALKSNAALDAATVSKLLGQYPHDLVMIKKLNAAGKISDEQVQKIVLDNATTLVAIRNLKSAFGDKISIETENALFKEYENNAYDLKTLHTIFKKPEVASEAEMEKHVQDFINQFETGKISRAEFDAKYEDIGEFPEISTDLQTHLDNPKQDVNARAAVIESPEYYKNNYDNGTSDQKAAYVQEIKDLLATGKIADSALVAKWNQFITSHEIPNKIEDLANRQATEVPVVSVSSKKQGPEVVDNPFRQNVRDLRNSTQQLGENPNLNLNERINQAKTMLNRTDSSHAAEAPVVTVATAQDNVAVTNQAGTFAEQLIQGSRNLKKAPITSTAANVSDARGNFLAEIRNGKQLKKVNRVSFKTKPNELSNEDLMNQALVKRRQVIAGNSESSEA